MASLLSECVQVHSMPFPCFVFENFHLMIYIMEPNNLTLRTTSVTDPDSYQVQLSLIRYTWLPFKYIGFQHVVQTIHLFDNVGTASWNYVNTR